MWSPKSAVGRKLLELALVAAQVANSPTAPARARNGGAIVDTLRSQRSSSARERGGNRGVKKSQRPRAEKSGGSGVKKKQKRASELRKLLSEAFGIPALSFDTI
jgi:hypothetical protein